MGLLFISWISIRELLTLAIGLDTVLKLTESLIDIVQGGSIRAFRRKSHFNNVLELKN
jgi:hypothetical protein